MKTTVSPLSPQTIWATFRAAVVGRGFARHVGVLTVANFIGAAFGIVQGVLVARWLGPQLYGVAALVMSYPNLLFTIVDARSVESSVRYLGEFTEQGEKERALAICKLGYMVDMSICLLTFGLVAATAWWAENRVVHTEGTVWLMIGYAAIFSPRFLVGTSSAALVTLGRFSLLAWVQGLIAVFRTTLVLGLVSAGWGVSGVIWGNGAALGVQGIILGIVAYPVIRQTWGGSWLAGSLHVLKGRRRGIFGFMFYNELYQTLGLFSKEFDLTLLGYFRGPQEAGYYRLAKSLAGVAGYLVGPLQLVTYPRLVRLWQGAHMEELRRTLYKLVFGIGIPLGVAALAFTPAVPLVIRFILGEAFSPAIVPAQFLLGGSAVWLAFFWLRPLFLARGDIKAWTFIMSCVIVLLILGFLIVTPIWGYLGMAVWLFAMQALGHVIAGLYAFGRRSRETM